VDNPAGCKIDVCVCVSECVDQVNKLQKEKKVICLAWGADLHIPQLMPLPLTVSCSSKSRLVLPSSSNYARWRLAGPCFRLGRAGT